MTITLETEKETRDTFVKEVEKDELELLIRRTTNIEIPKGWELTDEVFKKLDGELVSNGDEWIDSDRWDWNEKGSKPIEDWLGISEKPKEMN